MSLLIIPSSTCAGKEQKEKLIYRILKGIEKNCKQVVGAVVC